MPYLEGKTCVVTGASAGIGIQVARMFSERGSRVVMAIRNVEKGEKVAATIRSEQPNAMIDVMELDLSSLDSVQSFSNRFLSSHDRLDILINNAGVYDNGKGLRTTQDGFALLMGVNHLGHFALTGHLLQRLLDTPKSRVVTVSSGAHSSGKIDLRNFHKTEAAKRNAYGDSKLANMLFALELQRRLALIDSNTISVAAGPGATKSDAVHAAIESISNGLLRLAADMLTNIVMEPTEMGAMPSLRAATDPEARGGDYFVPGGFLGMRGYPKAKKPAKSAQHEELARGLWQRSVELTNVAYLALSQSG